MLFMGYKGLNFITNCNFI